MKFTYMSKMKRPIIVYKPIKVNSDAEVTQEPIRIEFRESFYQTDNEEIAKFIEALPNFGADYWKVDGIKPVEDTGPKYGITAMDTPEQLEAQRNAENEQRFQKLEGAVNDIAGLLKELVKDKVKTDKVVGDKTKTNVQPKTTGKE